jgi:hypothetical protein
MQKSPMENSRVCKTKRRTKVQTDVSHFIRGIIWICSLKQSPKQPIFKFWNIYGSTCIEKDQIDQIFGWASGFCCHNEVPSHTSLLIFLQKTSFGNIHCTHLIWPCDFFMFLKQKILVSDQYGNITERTLGKCFLAICTDMAETLGCVYKLSLVICQTLYCNNCSLGLAVFSRRLIVTWGCSPTVDVHPLCLQWSVAKVEADITGPYLNLLAVIPCLPISNSQVI